MGVDEALRRLGEALVVVGDELGHKCVGRVDVADRAQSQLLDQAILQGLVGPLDPPLGLGRVGMDGADVERLERARELGQLAFPVTVVDPEDAVAVGIEGHRMKQVDHSLTLPQSFSDYSSARRLDGVANARLFGQLSWARDGREPW